MSQPGASPADDGRPIVVRDAATLRALEADLFAPKRRRPIVVVTARDGTAVVRLDGLSDAIQSDLICYYVPGTQILRKLNSVLGKALAVWPESLRIFWPQLRHGCDPSAHPLVPVMHNEPEAEVLDAFGYAFDLSRPRVRRARELDLGVLMRELEEMDATLARSRYQDRRHILKKRRLRRNSHSLARRRSQWPGEEHK